MPNPYTINIDQNTYYPSGNITIFPSSNAVDSGKLMTEFNGRYITINITDLNYVVSPNPGGYDISFNNETNKVDIQPGKAIINGFEVNTNVVVNYRLPTADEITTEGYYKGYALLCLHTLFDALDNLSGNVQVGANWYCEGIRVEYVSYEDYNSKPNEYLLLGGVKENGEIKINKDKYTRIDAKYILVKIEGDDETGAPPDQSTDLLTFINNFLKGYWVSKAGDNEYGELLFKSAPDGYYEEGFDYKTEDPLTSNKFGVKITKSGSTIIIKPEIENEANIVTQQVPGILGFYAGLFKGNDNTAFDNWIQSSADLPTDVYTKANLLQILTDGGAIRLKHKNDGPVLSVENNTSGHNGVEAGNVIYANNTGSNILDTDTTTAYIKTINYLVDSEGRIKTVNATDLTKYVYIDSTGENPQVCLNNGTFIGKIKISTTSYDKGNNNSAWENVLDLSDNVRIKSENTDSLGSLQAEGFIYAGSAENPASQQVPDIAHLGGNRPLKSGEIFAENAVWQAVYNDVAEYFELSPDIKIKDKRKLANLVMAVDKNHPGTYTIANRKTCNSIVGVVSLEPAFCSGVNLCKNGVPIAILGRVTVYCDSNKINVGDYVGLSKKNPGHVVKCRHNSKYRCGIVSNIIEHNTIEICLKL